VTEEHDTIRAALDKTLYAALLATGYGKTELVAHLDEARTDLDALVARLEQAEHDVDGSERNADKWSLIAAAAERRAVKEREARVRAEQALRETREAAMPFGFDPDGPIEVYPSREDIMRLRAALVSLPDEETT
jgi:hypothetical protein